MPSRGEELLLTETLARLGALVLERDQLLRGWAETRASELALAETKAQMDTFLGIASHELKTPLTSLKLSLQLAERRLRRLTRGARRWSGMAGEDARTGRRGGAAGADGPADGAAGAAGQRPARCLADPGGQAGAAVRDRRSGGDGPRGGARAAAGGSSGRRTIQLPAPGRTVSVPVEADAGRIEQVVTNFLTNALKYSPADRPVEVGIAVEEEGEQARVWVRDQGPGLPPEEQEQIWERFHRAQGVEVQTGTGVGLGLGLYISRMIVERHHGQVGVDSVPGQGATFWFTLPLTPLATTPSRRAQKLRTSAWFLGPVLEARLPNTAVLKHVGNRQMEHNLQRPLLVLGCAHLV